MMQTWSSWQRFPDVKSGDQIEAPIGPGVYEVRHTLTGRLMAFGHAGNVANGIAELKLNVGFVPSPRFSPRPPLVPRAAALKSRPYGAESRADAKTAAQRLLGLR